MIGKLARFELKKQLSGPFFVIILCLLLAVNVLLNCGIREYTDEKERYEENSGREYPSTFWKTRKSYGKIYNKRSFSLRLFVI